MARKSLLAGVLDLIANRAEARRLARETVRAHTAQPRMTADMSYGYGNMWGGFSRASGAKFPGGQSKPIGGNLIWHWGSRNQARDIVSDSVHAYTLVHRKADTIIDRGLTLAATPDAEALGMSQEEAQKWAAPVNRAFDLWARSTSSHRSGLFNFKQAQHQLMVGHARDNDEFVRFYYSQRADLLSPLQWEIIDANQIRGDAVTATNLIPFKYYDGINRNPDGSERSYRIWFQPPGDDRSNPALVEREIPHTGEKSGRVMMIHGFQPEYAGQGRGYSQLGISMQEFEKLEDYILSVIEKAIHQSQLVGQVVPSDNKPASNPLENLLMPAAGPAPTYGFGATPVTGGVSVAGSVDQSPNINAVAIEEATFTRPGSVMVTSLDSGERIEYLRDSSPSQEYGAFVDAYLAPLVGAHGMSMELYKIQFAASYSAARAALAIIWRLVEMERAWWDTWCGSVVYRMWLSCEIAAGRVSCPGWSDPRLQEAWCAHRFIGTPPVQVDPTKEAEANMKNLQMSTTTLEQVTYANGTGDSETNMARNAKDFPVLPIPPWEQQIKVAATTVQESEAKAADQAKQDLAIAKAGAPKPGQNGNGQKPPAQREPAPVR